VSSKLINYINRGDTSGALNVPELTLQEKSDNITRLLYLHWSYVDATEELIELLTQHGVVVAEEHLKTTDKVGYLSLDIPAMSDLEEVLAQAESRLRYKIKLRVV
jgi:D-3-phosphoglycerate dehydrogenase